MYTKLGKPYSENFYYEVTISSDGTNPKYPKTDKPITDKFSTYFVKDSVMLSPLSHTYFIPKGQKWKCFNITEEPTLSDQTDSLSQIVLQAESNRSSIAYTCMTEQRADPTPKP